MVRISGGEGVVRSQTRQTAGSTMANGQGRLTADVESTGRGGLTAAAWRRKGWKWKHGGGETAKCVKSPGIHQTVQREDGGGAVMGGAHYQVIWRKWGAAPLRGGSSGHGPSTSSTPGGGTETVGFTTSVFPYPPLSHRLFVVLFCGISRLLRL